VTGQSTASTTTERPIHSLQGLTKVACLESTYLSSPLLLKMKPRDVITLAQETAVSACAKPHRSRFTDDNNAVQSGKKRKGGGDAEGVPHVILRFEHCSSSARFKPRDPPSTVTKLGISPESDGSFGRSNPLNLPSRNLATSGLGVICGNEVPDRSAVEHMLSTASTSPRNA
jgi:hypothetical protein